MTEYVLNISLGGRFFARAILSANDDITAELQAHCIRLRMGPDYQCALTKWQNIGKEIPLHD